MNTASYTDVNLPNGTTYCYRVRAYNAGGTSGYSNEQCATTSVATSYALTVAKSGTGGGVVTATGINCGSDCSELLHQRQLSNADGDSFKRIFVCRLVRHGLYYGNGHGQREHDLYG